MVYGDIQILIIEETFENLNGDCDKSLSEFEPKELNYNTNIILVHEDYETGTIYKRNGDVVLIDSFTIVLKGTPKRLVNAEFYFEAKHKTQKYFQVFDVDGKLLNSKKFKEVNRINDSVYVGIDYTSGQYGLYHYSGEVLFENLKYITPYFERENKEMGLIALYTTNDAVLYSLKFKKRIIKPTNYSKFSTNRSQVEFKDIVYHNNMLLINYGKDKSAFGLFSNETGEMIVKGYPQMNVDFSFQLIMAKNNKTAHLYDFESNLLNVFQDVDTVIPISQKHFLVSRDKKVGIWSQQTKTYIVDIAFENIDFSLPDVFLAQSEDNKITVFDTIGKEVFPNRFNSQKVIFENIYTVSESFRNLNNIETFNIKPSLVYSGSSKSIHFQFTQEQYYMPDNISDFYAIDYDRILKEFKKEIITVVLQDSSGNRYRLMPNYILKPLSNESELDYRIMDVYFYKGTKENQNFLIDRNNDKHMMKGFETKYYNNKILVIVTKREGENIVYYPLNPQKGILYPTVFQSLDFTFEDSLYYYGESANEKKLLTDDLELIFTVNKNYELYYKKKNYYIVITDMKKKEKYRVYNNQKKLLFNHNCVIFPKHFDDLFGIRSCEHEFLGYVNINGTKYFD